MRRTPGAGLANTATTSPKAVSGDGTAWLLFAVLLVGALASLAVTLHSNWALYARVVREWEQRAADYRASLQVFSVLEEAGRDSELIAMFLRHDREGLSFCEKTASAWRDRIPRWLRNFYLRAL